MADNADDAVAVVDDAVTGDDTTQEICKVYDKNDFFTVFIQILLGFAALASLYIKRIREVPRRTFTTWFLDVSKQGFGACYAHVCNMVIAALISKNIRGDSVLDDQCAWYAMSYLIDTTLGLVLAILFLQLLDQVAKQQDWVSLKHSGVYTGPSAITHWAHQVMAWMLILTVVKMIIYVFMVVFSNALAWVGAILFEPIQGNIRFELVFVMILFPGVLNLIYFWIADSYLKADPEHTDAHDDDELKDKKETLLTETEIAAYSTGESASSPTQAAVV